MIADLNIIYEQNQIKSAICPYNDAELAEFISEKLKFDNPDKLNINGMITADLIIERDGEISDVIIVEGLHPTIDKEAVVAMKQLSKFTPGKLNETPVRSKYQIFLVVKTSI